MKNIILKRGFSLIELMMVIVIIGFLAGVGIPQYQKVLMKARQSEAKSLLSAMYTAQKSFYSEWNQYYGDFNAVGYGLKGDLGYHVGFGSAGLLGPKIHPSTTYRERPPVVRLASVFCSNNSEAGCTVIKAKTVATIAGTEATENKFLFGAAANLDADAALDRWTVNENKIFQQQEDDITQ